MHNFGRRRLTTVIPAIILVAILWTVALVVAMVNDAASPLAELADVVILLQAGPERSVAATKTFLGTCVAFLHLAAAWSGDPDLDGALRQTPARLDVAQAATHATFEVMSRSLFSGDAELTSGAAAAHITATLASAGKYSIAKLIGAPWLDRSRIRRQGMRGAAFLRAQLTELIRRRQSEAAAKG